MIDHTNNRIEEHEAQLRRANRRRYAFHRMLQATDRVLWRLEELNRDGVKAVPKRARAELRDLATAMPRGIGDRLRDTGVVQDSLDSLFEVQEQLFRWRFPDWHDWDPDASEDVAS
ncbi:MAG TPA: hypothetical protein VKE27_11770 [Candidatus Dormibacteraeota bacterium]|nr:hypothetical protein [Candidatus Dormibacteraeota bacterium]